MIRENNVTIEYELDGEKVYTTRDEDGIINSFKNDVRYITWEYDTEGNIYNIESDFLIMSIPIIKEYIKENVNNIINKGKLISYTMDLDKLGLTVTLDSNDKVTKIKGKEFEYEYEYNEVNKVYDIIIKDNSLIISSKLIDNTYNILTTVLEALVLIKSINNNTSNKPDMRGNVIPSIEDYSSKIKSNKERKNLIYDKFIHNRVKKRGYLDTINKRYVNTENIIPSFKDSHFGRLSQILYNQPLKINTEGRNKMSTNKSKIDLEEIEREDKIKYSPDEFPGFFKDPNKNKESKVMLSDLFKLEKAIQVIKLLEEDYSSSFSLNEIKEIALNSIIFDKYGKDNFSIEIFNRDCVQKIIASKNVKVTTVLNKDNDCTVGYYDNIVQKVTIHPDFNINKKYAFLIDNTTSKTITLLLYIPSHYPITHSDDVMRIIKEYGLE